MRCSSAPATDLAALSVRAPSPTPVPLLARWSSATAAPCRRRAVASQRRILSRGGIGVGNSSWRCASSSLRSDSDLRLACHSRRVLTSARACVFPARAAVTRCGLARPRRRRSTVLTAPPCLPGVVREPMAVYSPQSASSRRSASCAAWQPQPVTVRACYAAFPPARCQPAACSSGAATPPASAVLQPDSRCRMAGVRDASLATSSQFAVHCVYLNAPGARPPGPSTTRTSACTPCARAGTASGRSSKT